MDKKNRTVSVTLTEWVDHQTQVNSENLGRSNAAITVHNTEINALGNAIVNVDNKTVATNTEVTKVKENVSNINTKVVAVSSELENVKTYNKGISILELAKVLKKDITNSVQCSEVIQNAVDNYDCVYFPNGEYKLANTVNIKAQNTNGLELYGESFSETKIILDSNSPDTHIFNITSVKAWGNRYKYFKNLYLITNKAKLQSIFRCKEINENDIMDSGLQIENCHIATTGYVFDFRDCPWVGNSYIKNCEITGNGIAKIKPKRKWSDAYWHSTSNLVIEDVHFSGSTKRRGSVIDLVGCQNTQINRTTIEGIIYSLQDEADNIGDGFVGANNYNGGLFFNLKDSSVNFNTCWLETGGESNSPNALSGYIGGEDNVFSNPNIQVIFSNSLGYFQFDKGLQIGSGVSNGTIQNVKFTEYFALEDKLPFILKDGGLLTIDSLGLQSFTNNALLANSKIRISNMYLANEKGSFTVGKGLLINNNEFGVLYQYNGGYQDNKDNTTVTINKKYKDEMCHYPHLNPKFGNTLLIKADEWAFRFAQGNIWVEGEKNINAKIKYRMIHCNEANKLKEGKVITKYICKTYKDEYCNINDSDLYNNGTTIPVKDSCEFIELLELTYNSNGYIIKNNFKNTESYQTYNVYDAIYINQINLEGTWKKGDIVYMADGKNKTIFTSYGTSRPINITKGITLVDSKTIKITAIEDFKQVVDGDYIKLVTATSEISNIIDHIEYTKTGYLIILSNTLAENTTSITAITNNNPTKVIVAI